MIEKRRLERERRRERRIWLHHVSQWREQLRMLYMAAGKCLEAGVFITVFTRCAMTVPALVCVCVSLISVLSFNMFARLTMNRYSLEPFVTSHCHLCHLALFIISLCIPSVFSSFFTTCSGSQEDQVVLQCTATVLKEQIKLCLSCEGFGNRLCFLETTSNAQVKSLKRCLGVNNPDRNATHNYKYPLYTKFFF